MLGELARAWTGDRDRRAGSGRDRGPGQGHRAPRATRSSTRSTDVAYGWPVPATGRPRHRSPVDTDAALALPGVLAVLWHGNAPRLAEVADRELLVLQRDRIAYRGQFVAAVVADSLEAAREAAARAPVRLRGASRTTPSCAADRPGLYTPGEGQPRLSDRTPSRATSTPSCAASRGARRRHLHDRRRRTTTRWSRTPRTARWRGGRLLVHDSNQGAYRCRADPGRRCSACAEDRVRVVSRARRRRLRRQGHARPHVVLAALAARLVGRPVRLALTRQQHVRAGRLPHPDDPAGPARRRRRRPARARSATRRSSRPRPSEFAEQTAVVHPDDVRGGRTGGPRTGWPASTCRRRPGCAPRASAPGMFALESAMDELAVGVRHRPGRAAGPQRARPSTRRAATRSAAATWSPACARAPAGSAGPAATRRPGVRRARALAGRHRAWPRRRYPARSRPASTAAADDADGALRGSDQRHRHRHRRPDGALAGRRGRARRAARTGSRSGSATATCRPADVAGGSMGTASWGWAVVKACRELRDADARPAVPPRRLTVEVDTADDVAGAGRALVPARVRRAVRRGAGGRRHRRGPGVPRCSASSRPAGSSTRPRPGRSSSAA